MLDGLDALLSITQLPPGVPVARRRRQREKRGDPRDPHPDCCAAADERVGCLRARDRRPDVAPLASIAALGYSAAGIARPGRRRRRIAGWIVGSASPPLLSRASRGAGTTTRIATVISRYSRPAMQAIWSDEEKLARWLEVELAALDAWAELGVVPAEAARTIREQARAAEPGAGRRARGDPPPRHGRVRGRGRGDARRGGPLVPLRPDLLRRRRHGALAAGARGGRAARRRPRPGAGRGDRPGARAQAHGVHRPDARRPRGADDVRAQARGLGLRARARPRAAAPARSSGCASASSPAWSAPTRRPIPSWSASHASGSGSSRSPCRRRFFSATGTPSC